MRQDIRKGEPERAGGSPAAVGSAGRARLSWRGLARIAAAGDLLVLAAVGIGRRDLEAVAIAALLLVAVFLAGRRRGLVGLVLLALLFVDVAAFMLPAAVSNATAGEALGGVALPAALAAMSVAGLIAAVVAVVTALRARTARRDSGTGRGPAVVAACAAAALVLALGAVAVAGPSRAAAAQGSQLLELQAARTAFSTTSLEAHPGRVTVSLANHDLFWHTFTIERLHANVDVPVAGTRSVTFTAAPGTYTFVCTIPGHASAGMRGTLVVR